MPVGAPTIGRRSARELAFSSSRGNNGQKPFAASDSKRRQAMAVVDFGFKVGLAVERDQSVTEIVSHCIFAFV